MKHKVKKNTVRRRTDKQYAARARGLIAGLLVLLFCVGVFRVGFIMIAKGNSYRAEAESQQLYDEVIPAVRGTIYDSNMTPLVTGSSAWILVVDPGAVKKLFDDRKCSKVVDGRISAVSSEEKREEYLQYLSAKLAPILGDKKKDIYETLSKDSRYIRLKRKLGAAQRLQLDELFQEKFAYSYYVAEKGRDKGQIKPYTFKNGSFFRYEDDSLRIYPDNHFASTVIGVLDYDGNGMTGVERAYNDVLQGEPGRKVTARDGKNHPIEARYETVKDPVEGNGVVLTIDSNIQMYLENALKQALANTKAKGVFGMVMDVDTGAVLAISDKPDFDLNDAHKLVDKNALKALEEYKGDKNSDEFKNMQTAALYDQWNNYCVSNTYEPGSTFKIFTAAAALEEGVVSLNTTYTCRGAYKVADRTIHCANLAGHGTQTFTQGLMNSCNPFFIDIGQKLGVETYYKYFDAFGFTSKTGIDLTGEAMPVYHKLEKMGKVELASTSFGQSVRLSPVQLITAACAIANGGKLMKPYVVDSIVSGKGAVISKTEPTVKRQVISESTAATVRQMMEAVVEGGTGKNAYIPGFRVAGKTATSQKLDLKEEEQTNQMKYVASFVCFAPADDPKVAILVGVDEPPGNYRGGGVLAAPIAREVMEPTLKYLNVKPQYTAKELSSVSKTAPDLIGESVNRAKIKAANEGLSVKTVGDGETVVSQVPSAGQSIPSGGVIVVYTKENTEAQVVEVPDFTGMSVSGANKAANDAGINIVISGPASEAGAEVYSQSVAKGTKVQTGSSVTLNFHSTTKTVD